MKSHTGGAMSLDRGMIYGTSVRQKINTKSSTEGELVGVNDVMPQILWTRYFIMEAQGYNIKDTVVYQDNQSAILLENNGRASIFFCNWQSSFWGGFYEILPYIRNDCWLFHKAIAGLQIQEDARPYYEQYQSFHQWQLSYGESQVCVGTNIWQDKVVRWCDKHHSRWFDKIIRTLWQLGHSWSKKEKKKNVPKNESKTDVSNFTTTGIVGLMSMKIGSFYFKSPLYKQIDHPVPIVHWICCLICTELLL